MILLVVSAQKQFPTAFSDAQRFARARRRKAWSVFRQSPALYRGARSAHRWLRSLLASTSDTRFQGTLIVELEGVDHTSL